jgi:predicted RNA-binding Zn-ribbon protein involved in translation (DUF1610 family)
MSRFECPMCGCDTLLEKHSYEVYYRMSKPYPEGDYILYYHDGSESKIYRLAIGEGVGFECPDCGMLCNHSPFYMYMNEMEKV